jgi:hypothetical protein
VAKLVPKTMLEALATEVEIVQIAPEAIVTESLAVGTPEGDQFAAVAQAPPDVGPTHVLETH